MNDKNLQTNCNNQTIWLVILWLACALWLVFDKWDAIAALQLVDTDDNLRLQQVRDWMAGQPWYDMRQYRLSPPQGADMHWSRLVDLPLAGLIALFSLFGSVAFAERVAVTLAPLLAFGMVTYALVLTVRRLVAPGAALTVPFLLIGGPFVIAMLSPLRIDHHGWQLALLSLMLFGLIDERRIRGGVLAGAAVGLSLAIGIELLPYLGLVCALMAAYWLFSPREASRILAFGVTVSAMTALAMMVFVPPSARFVPYCDALSVVHLNALSIGGAGLVLCGLLSGTGALARWPVRAVLLALIGAGVIFVLWRWYPHCLADPSAAIDADARRLWLSNVREARPVYRQSANVQAGLLILPMLGIIGMVIGAWRNRAHSEKCRGWLTVGVLALFALGFCLFQTRAGSAAQLLAVPGAAMLGWWLWGAARRFSIWLCLVVVALGGFALSGYPTQFLSRLIAEPKKPSPTLVKARIANRHCATLDALSPLNDIAPGTMFTFLDLSPRMLVGTHHAGIAGPYHRNGRAIADVMKSFGGDVAGAERIIRRYHADYVLICPDVSEATIYVKRAPDGFYASLLSGEAPDWLEPVPLAAKTPYRLWRVRYP